MKKTTLTKRAAAVIALFAVIFGLAFYLRQFTFWLPHWQGDQSQYVILAMKIDSENSLAAYNLSETNAEQLTPADPPGTRIATIYRAKGQLGSILESYRHNSIGFYDMPFFCKAPLLPIVLALSHKWLAPPGDPFSIVESNLGPAVLKIKPELYLNTQFWAAIVPFAANLMILILTFGWVWRRFGDRAALCAAFILAVNPVSILTSNRIWTEDLATLFITLSMIVYFDAFNKKRLWLCFLSGVFMGLAAMTNQKSLLISVSVFLFTILAMRAEGKTRFRELLLDPRWWCYAAAVTLVTAWWFIKITLLYGSPIWMPDSTKISPTEWGWYRVLLSRPHGIIFYPVGMAAISWGFVAGYLTLRDVYRASAAAWSGKKADLRVIFCWCWILPIAAYYMRLRTGEYRYLFPMYPALAALSGWMLVRLEERLKGIFLKPVFATIAIILFLSASAAYSVPQAMKSLWLQRNPIHAPWH